MISFTYEENFTERISTSETADKKLHLDGYQYLTRQIVWSCIGGCGQLDCRSNTMIRMTEHWSCTRGIHNTHAITAHLCPSGGRSRCFPQSLNGMSSYATWSFWWLQGVLHHRQTSTGTSTHCSTSASTSALAPVQNRLAKEPSRPLYISDEVIEKAKLHQNLCYRVGSRKTNQVRPQQGMDRIANEDWVLRWTTMVHQSNNT